MKNRQAGATFIFFTVLIDMIGIGMIIPVLPDVLKRFISDPAQAAAYFGYFTAIYGLLHFLASPLLGSLSDLFGRRPILLLSLAVAGLDYLMMAFAPTLFWLFLGRVVSGVTAANITVAMAYIADVSTPENRAKSFGLVGAAFGLGFIIGPAIGGALAHFGPTFPFIAAAVLNGVNFFYGLFVLPESLPEDRRRKFGLKQLNPFQFLKLTVQTPGLGLILFAMFLIQLSGSTHPSIWTLYTGYRFGWTPAQVGLSLAFVGVVSAVAQGGLVRWFVPKFGEVRAGLLSTVIFAFGMLAYGFATQGWMMFVIMAVFGLISMAGQPALQSLVSQQVPPDRQGELQGANMSLAALASTINPLIVTLLFSKLSVQKEPFELLGAPYYFAGLCGFLGLGALVLWVRGRALTPTPDLTCLDQYTEVV